MTGIVEFLTARLDEDEQTALAALSRYEPDEWTPPLEDPWPEDEAHVLRHHPARVLADVAAKRKIIGEYERYAAERRRELGGWNTDGVSPILTALAAVDADHPDYEQAWRAE